MQDCLYLHFISELIKKIEHNEIVQHKAAHSVSFFLELSTAAAVEEKRKAICINNLH